MRLMIMTLAFLAACGDKDADTAEDVDTAVEASEETEEAAEEETSEE